MVEISKIPEVFRNDTSEDILQRYMMDSQLSQEIQEVSSGSMLNPRE